MPKKRCQIRVGTSGWHYAHWQGPLYSKDLPKTKWLSFYAEHFDTVEINNTFYHLPQASTFENWKSQVSTGFLFTLKASRYITHIKRLLDADESVDLFLERAEPLGDQLGPILFQLPPTFRKDLDRLETFLQAAQNRLQGFIEFRHKSWYEQDTWDLLEKFGFGVCVHDWGDAAAPRVITARRIYVRLHGSGESRYEGKYTPSQMEDWAGWINEHRKEVSHIYAYFNNDIHGYAVENARTLRSLLEQD